MQFLLKLTDTVSRIILWGFALSVIFLAIMTSLLRYYLPQANHYREPLLELISKQSSYRIQADEISAQWQFFKPDIRLQGVAIEQAISGQKISLDYLRVQVNIAKTLFYRQLYIDTLEADNLDIVLAQNAQGEWTVSSQQSQARASISLDRLIRQFWLVNTVSLSGIRLSMTPYEKETLEFPSLTVSMQTWLNEKILELDLYEQQELRSKLVVQTQNYYRDADFSADIYWRTIGFPLHSVLPLIDGVELSKESRISDEVWLQWRNQQLSGSGEFVIDQLDIQHQGEQWRAEKANGSFYIEHEQGDTVLAIPALAVKLNQQQIAFEKIKLRFGEESSLQIEQLDLSAITRYLKLLNLPPKLEELRDDLQPQGFLNHVQIQFKQTDILFRAELASVSVGAWKGAPALQNVTGYVEANKLSGFVALDSQSFSMAFPVLYDNRMDFDHAAGTIFWRVDDKIRVGSNGLLYLDGPYGQAVGEFQLELPLEHLKEEQAGYLSIVVDLQDGDIAYRQHLIPTLIDPGLYAWLDESILDGWVKQGSFIFHGPIGQDVPSDEIKVVELWLDIERGKITYADGFMPVENIRGEFLLDHDVAFARIDSATSAGLAVKQGSVDLLIGAENKTLAVKATLQQQKASKVLGFLRQKAIKNYTKEALMDWQSDSGWVDADIQVLAPLNKLSDINVIVDSRLKQVDLRLQTPALHVQAINGDLRFDLQQGVSANNLDASLWGEAVSAHITAGATNSLQFDTVLRAESLQAWLARPELRFIQGQTAINGKVFWGAEQNGIEIHSQLLGMSLDLPKPFSKTEEDAWPLVVSMPLMAGQKELLLKVEEGLQLGFLMDEKGIDAAVVAFGMVQPQYVSGEIQVQGQVLEANTQQWIETVERYRSFISGSKTDISNNQTGLSLHIDQLTIRNFDLFGYPLSNARFSAIERTLGWSLDIQQQNLHGKLLLSKQDDRPLIIELEQLNIAAFTQQATAEPGLVSAEKLSQLPAMNVSIDRVLSDQQDYGQWRFLVRPHEQKIHIKEIQATVRFMQLKALDPARPCQLTWDLAEYNTEFDCRFYSEDIDEALKAWDLAQNVESKSFTLDVQQAHWQGSPMDFSLTESVLPVSLRMDDGYFADVDSSATDALKVVSIFNISNLVRRLKLDFSDMTQDGLSFDKVRGGFLLDNGVLSSVIPLSIKSASSSIRISGVGDFNNDSLDLDMSVSLPLASNLPWIIALAAGLPAAVGVFLISKLLGKQVNKLSTLVYKISGSMQEPKIQFKSLFDVNNKNNSKTSEAEEQ